MAAPPLPSSDQEKVYWLSSSDGSAMFKWTMPMLQAYLPNIKTCLDKASDVGLIIPEGLSAAVLSKIDPFLRFVVHQESRTVAQYERLIIDFFSELDVDMMKSLLIESRKRSLQVEAAGYAPAPGVDSGMALMADLTADICSVCIDQEPQYHQVRFTRLDRYDVLLQAIVRNIRGSTQQGYYGRGNDIADSGPPLLAL